MMSNGPRSPRRSQSSGARDLRALRVRDRRQDVHDAEAFAREAGQRAAQHLHVAAHRPGAYVARAVARVALRGRQVERERHRRRMVAARELDRGQALLGAQMRRVEHRQRARGQAARGMVEGRDLGGLELARSEGRLAASRRAHQHDQREIRNREPHRRVYRPRARARSTGVSVAPGPTHPGSYERLSGLI